MKRQSPWTGFRLGLVSLTVVLAGLIVFCAEPKKDADSPPGTPPSSLAPSRSSEQAASGKQPPAKATVRRESPEQTQARHRMVEHHLRGRDITDARVLEVMGRLPRHEFVPAELRESAYADHPLPIGHGQTISQPYVVALMTQMARAKPAHRALDIGTGSGYQAAVLAELCKEVYSIEIVEPLAASARERLKRLGYENVTVRAGDGYRGWPEKAPFDKIIVTCSPEHIPPALVEQLREGGRMVIPFGPRYQQNLCLMKKVDGKMETEAIHPTLFVPMTGQAEEQRQRQPDPAHPSLYNGDFEELIGDSDQAAGWHYARQMEILAEGAASGKHCALFSNTEPGRNAQALQGLGVDGREVRQVKLALSVRAQDVRLGPEPEQKPSFTVIFYDERRAMVGQGSVGPWQGTFDWQHQSVVVAVPPKAREAIVRIGLFGAVGELGLDDIQIKPVTRE